MMSRAERELVARKPGENGARFQMLHARPVGRWTLGHFTDTASGPPQTQTKADEGVFPRVEGEAHGFVEGERNVVTKKREA